VNLYHHHHGRHCPNHRGTYPTRCIVEWTCIRKALEVYQDPHGVCMIFSFDYILSQQHPFNAHRAPITHSRSHLQRGVKTTSWEQRKEKETKEAAIRQLQQDLKDEKQADFTRCGSSSSRLSLPRADWLADERRSHLNVGDTQRSVVLLKSSRLRSVRCLSCLKL
jgi:hypothetical protein